MMELSCAATPLLNTCKVSVIVPNYNHAAYLPQRLHSILNQTYPHFELILLDDASTDASRDVIAAYQTHPKVAHIVYNETNSGTTFRQWDKGISLATGSLIWLAESDDWCEPTLLETILAGFAENPACVLGYVQAYALTNDGSILWQSSHHQLAEQLNGKRFIQQYLGKGNTIFNASMAVFKKEAFYQVSKEYTTYRFGGDWLFWAEIARQGDVFISGKLLNYFRNHTGDVSERAYGSGLNYVEDMRVWQAMRRNGLIDEALFQEVVRDKFGKFTEVKPYLDEAIAGQAEQLFKEAGYAAEPASTVC